MKEDGDPSLRQWTLSLLIEDKMDRLPSYNQWIGQLKDRVRFIVFSLSKMAADNLSLRWAMIGQRQVVLDDPLEGR